LQGRFCWLCGGELPALVAPSQEIVEIKDQDDVIVAEAVGLSPGHQRLLTWLAVSVVAVLGFGVAASQDWFVAVLYVAAVVPTLLVVLIGTTSARARGQPWSPGKTAAVATTTLAGTVLTTVIVVIVTLAIMVLVLFAMVIALIQQCFQALGGGS
jgi:hypothetical protein